jgi:hypothetical protein
MKTLTWEHDAVDTNGRAAFLFTYKVRSEIVAAIVENGGSMEWEADLYTDDNGEWRLPAMSEYGANGYLHHISGGADSGDLATSTLASPSGWGAAFEGGLMLRDGDKVRIELTCFDSGRHILEGWVASTDSQFAGHASYNALAHLDKSQEALGRELTREQWRALVADPTASVPSLPPDPYAAFDDEMRALRHEFAIRAQEISDRHGIDPRRRSRF